jgi:flagellar assembly protein FliH
MKAAPTKFLFENDFAKRASVKPTISLDEHHTQLKQAEDTAFARGLQQGANEGRAEVERRIGATIERIAATMATLDKQIGAVEAKIEVEAVDVAVAVAKKLAPQLVAKEPLAEISALATECFRNLVKCPHVVVRVSEALHESARAKLDEIVQQCGPATRLVVLTEPDIAVGDCRIEWADGGINRDTAAVAAAIEEAVTRYVGARRNDAGAGGTGASSARLAEPTWR